MKFINKVDKAGFITLVVGLIALFACGVIIPLDEDKLYSIAIQICSAVAIIGAFIRVGVRIHKM